MTVATIFDEAASRRLEAVYHTPDMVGQRREVLRALDPQPGEAVLDVGSGPGILLGELAQRVHPGGRATGVDLSESMLALARKRLRAEPSRPTGASPTSCAAPTTPRTPPSSPSRAPSAPAGSSTSPRPTTWPPTA